jgi:hypothetical protein
MVTDSSLECAVNRKTVILFLLLEVLLFGKLIIRKDFLLGFLILLTQLTMALVLLRVDPKFKIHAEISKAKKRFAIILIPLIVSPVFIKHVDTFELSNWHESGLYLRAPFSAVFLAYGLVFMIFVVIGSVYLRNKNGMD